MIAIACMIFGATIGFMICSALCVGKKADDDEKKMPSTDSYWQWPYHND